MRTRALNIRVAGRAAGYLLVAAAIIATAVRFDVRKSAPTPTAANPAPSGEPLAAELARCQSIGIAAQSDVACAQAWAENRRRFFTYRPSETSDRPAPTTPARAKPEDR
jgi:conjugative transfer region protein TrbK